MIHWPTVIAVYAFCLIDAAFYLSTPFEFRNKFIPNSILRNSMPGSGIYCYLKFRFSNK